MPHPPSPTAGPGHPQLVQHLQLVRNSLITSYRPLAGLRPTPMVSKAPGTDRACQRIKAAEAIPQAPGCILLCICTHSTIHSSPSKSPYTPQDSTTGSRLADRRMQRQFLRQTTATSIQKSSLGRTLRSGARLARYCTESAIRTSLADLAVQRSSSKMSSLQTVLSSTASVSRQKRSSRMSSSCTTTTWWNSVSTSPQKIQRPSCITKLQRDVILS